MPAPTDPEVQRLIRRFVAALLTRDADEQEQAVGRLNADVRASNPLLISDPELRHALDESTRGQSREFLAWLVAEQSEPTAPQEAVAFARLLARRGRGLDVLLRVYRSGQQATLQFITDTVEKIEADPRRQQRSLVALWSRALDWLNASVEQLIDAYADERESWLRGAIARRAEVTESILQGDPIDVDDASRLLGHNLRGCQTALELWIEDDARLTDQSTELDALARRLAAAVRAPRPLMIPSGRRSASVWLSTAHPPNMRQLTTTREERVTEKLRIAVGIPATGVAGFISSHREAVDARRVAPRLPRRAVVRYADVELFSLLLQNPPAFRTFLQRELGGLAAADAASARLRETVQLYLAAGAGEAADELGVHRNTVRYRLHQAEALIGHPLTERRLELELALHCVALDATPLGPNPSDPPLPRGPGRMRDPRAPSTQRPGTAAGMGDR